MEATKPLVNTTTAKLKLAALLWLEGFKEACCLHRVVILCSRSRKLLVRTGQCFLLNGLIFLGSLFVLNSVVIPTLQWILPDQCSQFSSRKLCGFGGILKFYSFLRRGLIHFFYVFWFYPLYVFSIILSAIWYNDIAKHGYDAIDRSKSPAEEGSSQTKSSDKANASNIKRLSGLGRFMIETGELVYSIILLSVFFLKVYATGFIPFIGKMLNFLLLSWMYAYYCFEVYNQRTDCLCCVSSSLSTSVAYMKPLCFGYIFFLATCQLWDYGYSFPTVCFNCDWVQG
ncbi:protein EI24 homolog isoform X2 [Neltuma alba]|uniref:protein EI24 homolog isoform X2 n=1 Tax=Neltuma alba TaxID=207710 RepID=UPI0010A2B4DE|nr:protein EI24 homolog isoform X2 [Prosopis alba]